jgi:hypothetical protein
MAELLVAGATQFAFINPGESVPGINVCPSGAFAYSIKGADGTFSVRCFPITSAPS